MSEHNPWKRVSSRMVYQNPWITVREDAVIRPDGNPGIYGVVETRIATGVVVLAPSEKPSSGVQPELQQDIFLIGQYRYTMEEYSWEIIEGGAEDGESPLEAATRELEEEAGLRALDWYELGGEIHLSNCHSSERGKLYIAQNLTETQSSPDVTEVLQRKRIPFVEALEMVQRGVIKDALSIIGIQRAEIFLKSGQGVNRVL